MEFKIGKEGNEDITEGRDSEKMEESTDLWS